MMISYLKNAKKYVFDMPNFAFKLYGNIVVPNRVNFDQLCPKRGEVEADFRLSNKVSVI
jgi:hypothetical protein